MKRYDDSLFRNVILNEFREFVKMSRVKAHWNNKIVGTDFWGEDFISIGNEVIEGGEDD